MFFNLRLRPKVGTFYSLPVSAAPILILSLFFFRVFLYERPFFSLYNLSNLSIGESLFTLFASLTYAYNYLMTLIKWKLWILKGHNSFSYLWKFEPSTPNGFGEILFKLKLEILQRMHGWYFLIAWKDRVENYTNCSNYSALSTHAFSSHIQLRLLWVKSYANEENCKQWRQQRFAYIFMLQRKRGSKNHNILEIVTQILVYSYWLHSFVRGHK